jgi:hypothetical protein
MLRVALTRAPSVCAEPGCAAIPVAKGRCREHARWPARNPARAIEGTRPNATVPGSHACSADAAPAAADRSRPAAVSSTTSTVIRPTTRPRTSSCGTRRATRTAAACTITNVRRSTPARKQSA